MISRLTLLEVKSESSKAIKNFFGNNSPVFKLNFSRDDFFIHSSAYINGMSISGVQQKLSLIINKENEFEIVSTNGGYILKPSPESFPYAAENEQCAMAISRYMKIETAYSANIAFSNGEEAYITRRYDRDNGIKYHQEDLAQAFNLRSSDKYQKSYEEALIIVRKMSGGKLAVVRDLFNRVVLGYVIGNDDMHLKNISLIKKSDSKSIYYDGLTPNYDQLLVHAFPNPSKLGFLALDLTKDEADGIYSEAYDKYGFYTATDFYHLGEKTGLRKPVVKTILNNYFQSRDGIIQIINNSFMPPDMKAKAIKLVEERIKALSINF